MELGMRKGIFNSYATCTASLNPFHFTVTAQYVENHLCNSIRVWAMILSTVRNPGFRRRWWRFCHERNHTGGSKCKPSEYLSQSTEYCFSSNVTLWMVLQASIGNASVRRWTLTLLTKIIQNTLIRSYSYCKIVLNSILLSGKKTSLGETKEDSCLLFTTALPLANSQHIVWVRQCCKSFHIKMDVSLS